MLPMLGQCGRHELRPHIKEKGSMDGGLRGAGPQDPPPPQTMHT